MMRQIPFKSLLAGMLVLVLCALSAHAQASQDVVLLLDNSTAMSAQDVRHLSSLAATEFAQSHGPDTRIAVIAYADTSAVLMPLTPVSDASRREISVALQRLAYRSPWTDTSSGLGRALAEIIDQGADNTQKSIILMTDSGVNTGNEAADLDKTRWIEQSLIPASVYNHVRIFTVSFTGRGDNPLLRMLADKTGGDSFQVSQPVQLAGVFERINTRVMDANLAGVATVSGGLMPPPLPHAGSVVPAKFDAPLTQHRGNPERVRWLGLLALVVLVAACFGVYAAWNLRTVKTPKTLAKAPEPHLGGPRAVLYDISNPNDIKRFELGERATLLGRVVGYDPEVQYVLIKEKTVGRCHAVIERRGHSFWLMDQGSVNGTFVNGERITADRALKHGDIVAIHRHEFEFMIPEFFESDATVVGTREQLTA